MGVLRAVMQIIENSMCVSSACRLPDFIGIGPPRTATTWLHGVLAERVGLPAQIKETRFFSVNYAKGLAWYTDHFRHCAEMPVVGEFSPDYFYQPIVRQRVHRDLPGCKIICTLRDPVVRLYSNYRLLSRVSARRMSFSEVLDLHPELLSASRYAEHLEGWFEAFGMDKVLTVFCEDLEASPDEFAAGVCTFLGVQPLDLASSAVAQRRSIRNTARCAPKRPRLAAKAEHLKGWLQRRGYHGVVRLFKRAKVWRFCFRQGAEFPPLPAEMELRLREALLSDVERLERLLDRDLSAFKFGGKMVRPRRGRTTTQLPEESPRRAI